MVDRANRPSALNAPSAATPGPQVDITGSGASSKVTATLPSGESVEVLLYGATVISWKSNGGKTENLWLSEKAALDGSKAVRGGIPVVFPVFGPPPKSGHPTSTLPQHGFARTSRWEFLGKSTSEDALDASSVKLDFGLYSSGLTEEARQAWPLDFGLVYSVTLSKDSLQTVMNVRNEGEKSFEFQMLLHTYFKIKVSRSFGSFEPRSKVTSHRTSLKSRLTACLALSTSTRCSMHRHTRRRTHRSP